MLARRVHGRGPHRGGGAGPRGRALPRHVPGGARLTFGTLLAKDLRLVARHRLLTVALLLYPLLLAVTLHAAFDRPPERLTVAILNEDADGEGLTIGEETLTSATLVERAGRVTAVVNVTSRAEGIALLRDGDVDALVVIPPDFVKDASRRGGGANVTLVVDDADPVRAGIARAAVHGFAQAFGREIVERKVVAVLRDLKLAVDGGTVRVLFFERNVQGLNETIREVEDVRGTLTEGTDEHRKLDEAVQYLVFARDALASAGDVLRGAALPLAVQEEPFARTAPRLAQAALPGALALSVFWTGALAAASLFAAEAESGGALTRMQATPTTAFSRAASKILVALALVALQAALVVALAALVWGETPASPGGAVPVVLLGAGAAAGMGALAAGLARGRAGAALLVVLVVLPMTLLSGLFFPVDYMPGWVQAVANALPLTHAVDAFRDVLVRGVPLAATAVSLVALGAFAAGGAVGAGLLLRGRV